MVNHVGEQLGNYRLVQMVGQGGFSDVYLGEHIHLRTMAAIKLLQMRLQGSNMEQFLNEARTIASIVHPHIVRVLDFGIEDGIPYLVMDYAANGTLRQRHPKGTAMAPQSIVPYVKQIALALQFAHDHKLIHRDIKPENMLLGSNNEVLLSDFGLVLIAQSTGSAMTQEMGGTIPYMAPEQLQGRPRAASDQYSLGVVVYEWLSGERPFSGSFVEIASQHILVPPPPLYGRIPGISPTLEQVVFSALNKDPRQRFASVQAFASTLEQVCLPVRPVQFTLPNPTMLASGNESSLPTYIKPLSSELSQPTYVVTPQDQISPPGLHKPQPSPTSIPSQPTTMVTPPGSAAQAAEMNTPIPGQSSEPTYVVTPSNQPTLPVTTTSQASQPTEPDQAMLALQPGVLVRGPDGMSPRPRRRALTLLLTAIIGIVLIASIFGTILFGLRLLFLQNSNTGTGSSLNSQTASSPPLATTVVKHTSSPTPSPTQTAPPPLPQPSPSSLDPTACHTGSTGWTCSVKLSLPSSALTYINWSTSESNNLSGVVFQPPSNKLTPGQTQSVSIYVPYGDCFQGSFLFIGKNTTIVSWNCTASHNPNPTPTPTPGPSPTPTPTSGPSPTPSPTPGPSPTPSPTPGPTPTPSPTPGPSPTPSPTPGPTPTPSPTPGPTPTPTALATLVIRSGNKYL